MTIVVAVLTGDGCVLASDSATTQRLSNGQQQVTGSIWNTANKIVNLRKTWPIGAMTFGRASFQGRSIATHCKELRRTFSADAKAESAWEEDELSVEVAAQALHAHFRALYDAEPGDVLGFLVGGFDAAEHSPTLWQVIIGQGIDIVECLCPPGEAGLFHQGMTDAITRLVDGASQDLSPALVQLGVQTDQADLAAEGARNLLSVPIVWQGMPLGEAIDLARFLVDTTISFVRFSPGDASVGGPVEVAAITKHEGFKWVQRKHYYRTDLNPVEEVNTWN